MVDEIAVSDEMVAVGHSAAQTEISDDAIRDIYRAMRALEPSAPDIPTFFDPVTDQRRAVTALDVEMWQAAASAYYGLRAKVEQDQALFRAEIKAIRSRHGAPHE